MKIKTRGEEAFEAIELNIVPTKTENGPISLTISELEQILSFAKSVDGKGRVTIKLHSLQNGIGPVWQIEYAGHYAAVVVDVDSW